MFPAKCFGVAIFTLTFSLGAQEESATEPQVYAQIQKDAAALRCFPTAHSPVYGETLAKGMFVRVLEEQGGFHKVELPLGVAGFVAKKFVGEIDKGFVTNEARRLSFRYEPKSGMAPVAFADKGAKFYVIDETEDGKWYRARYAAAPAWIAAADLQLITDGAANETVTAAWAELDKVQREQGTGFLAGIAAKEAAAKAKVGRAEAWKVIEASLITETKKPLAERDFSAVGKATEAHLETVPEAAEAERKVIAQFQDSITYNQMQSDAQKLVDEKLQAAVVKPVVAPKVESPMKRFNVIGRLRKRGYQDYVIEKGGQPQCAAVCSSGRYNLDLFVGCEVGLIGSKQERTHVEALRAVNVEKIEIISSKKR